MFENRKKPLLSHTQYRMRLYKHFAIAFAMVAGSLFIGMLGYHYLENLSWIDSLLNSSMILGGMGPINPLKTDAGKIFASLYALFSGIVFLIIVGVSFAPIYHRFLHKFHIEIEDEEEDKKG